MVANRGGGLTPNPVRYATVVCRRYAPIGRCIINLHHWSKDSRISSKLKCHSVTRNYRTVTCIMKHRLSKYCCFVRSGNDKSRPHDLAQPPRWSATQDVRCASGCLQQIHVHAHCSAPETSSPAVCYPHWYVAFIHLIWPRRVEGFCCCSTLFTVSECVGIKYHIWKSSHCFSFCVFTWYLCVWSFLVLQVCACYFDIVNEYCNAVLIGLVCACGR